MSQATSALGALNQASAASQSAMAGLAGAALKLGGAYVGFQALKTGIEDLVSVGAKLEMVKIGLDNLAGSLEAGARQYQFVSDLANKYGLELAATAEHYKNFAQATRNTSMAGAETEEMFTHLIRATRAHGLSTAQAMQTVELFRQALSRGTIQSQQLVRGLQAMPGGLNAIASALGVTTDQLRVMANDQELFANLVLPRVARAWDRDIGEGSKRAADSVESNANRMKNAWSQLGDSLVEGSLGKGLIWMMGALKYSLEGWDILVTKITGASGIPMSPDQKKMDATPEAQAVKGTGRLLYTAEEKAKEEREELSRLRSEPSSHPTALRLQEDRVKAAEAEEARLKQIYAAQLDALDKVRDAHKGITKEAEKQAATDKAIADDAALKTEKMKEAVQLQVDLNKLQSQYNTTLSHAAEEIAEHPARREEILKETLERLHAIRKTMDALKASNKDLLTLTPGTSTLPEKAIRDISEERWKAAMPIFQQVAAQSGVPLDLLAALGIHESALNPRAISSKGAQGIMQLMPDTQKELGVTDPYDMTQNIVGGAKLLARLLKKYHDDVDLALAAYSAGEGAVTKYGNKVPPYKETINEIADVKGLRTQLGGTGAPAVPGGERIRTQTAEMEVGRTLIESQLTELKNGEHLIKMYEDLQKEVRKLSMLPEDFAQYEAEHVNAVSAEIQKLKAQLMQSPAAFKPVIEGLIKSEREQVSVAFAEHTIRQIQLKIAKNVDDLSGDITNKTSGFRHQIASQNWAIQHPSEAQGLGLTDDELRLPRYAASARMQQASEAIAHMAKMGANEEAVKKLREDYRDLFSKEGLAGGAQFLQQLQDEHDALTMTEKDLLAQKMALDGASQAQMKQTEALRVSNKIAADAGQMADFVSNAFQDMATGGETNFKRLAQSFQRMVLQMIFDAAGVRQALQGLFDKGIKGLLNLLPGAGGGSNPAPGTSGISSEAAGAWGASEGIGAAAPAYAIGGWMAPNSVGWVGENGPELVAAGSHGATVTPVSGRGETRVTVNFHGVQDMSSMRKSQGEINSSITAAVRKAQRDS